VLLIGMLAMAGALLAGGPADAAKRKPKKQKPNIVVVLTDDQARNSITPEAMPNLHEKLIGQGTTFTDYVVTTPLCCPSRASLLTGQYGHNNGVLRNFYPDLKQKGNVLPSWLQRSGYTTAHVGKFLNAYEQDAGGPAAVAPGWDKWFTQLEKRRYYNWKASKNGRIRHFGSNDADHATTVFNDYAESWTKQLVKRDEPFYLQVDHYAPHASGGRDTRCSAAPVPEAVDEGRFAGAPLPQPPNFDEEDVSDKPKFIRDRPRLTAEDQEKMERRYRCTLEAAYGIDRGIGKIYRAVANAGELKRTIFVFTSDNGYFFGEHRIPKGKPQPYEENIRVPLTMLVPRGYRKGVDRIATSSAPTANIDVAPTLLRLARAEPCRSKRVCRTLDGRSLLPLLNGTSTDFPQPRAIGIEISECTYRGARYDGRVYFQYANPSDQGCAADEREHYDLRADPFQLENLIPAPPDSEDSRTEDKLRRLTERLQDCAGIRGRDPRPRSGHYCR